MPYKMIDGVKHVRVRKMWLPCHPTPLDVSTNLTGTDTQFIAMNRRDAFDGDDKAFAYAKKQANEAGVDTNGKWYSSQMASSPYGADGWIGGLDDVKRQCEEKGHGCKGSVNTPVRFTDDHLAAGEGDYKVADQLVHDDLEMEYTEHANAVGKPVQVTSDAYDERFVERQAEMSAGV